MDNLETMVDRYIITAAEIGAQPNNKQLDAYERYAKEMGAEIVVVPMRGQHNSEEDVLHDRFNQYMVTNNYILCKGIAVRDFGVKAQNINPLTGLRRFGSVGSSMIVGSPKQHLEFVANSANNDPRAVMSTGACTFPNYKEKFRIGKIGLADHRQGAVLVDVEDDGTYHFRQIQNNTDGSFISLGRRYFPKGRSKQIRADTLVVGDLHDAQKDMVAYKKTLDMIGDLKPKYVVLHDTFDGYSVSHHDKGKLMTRGRKSKLGQTSLYQELRNTGSTLTEILEHGPKDMQLILVKSNHDEVLDKYLEDVRFVGDAQNIELSVRLAAAYLDGADPLQEGIYLTHGQLPPQVKFLQRDSEFSRYGWHLSSHGDKGPSGSRGSKIGFEYSLGKAIVGHGHSPWIRKDVRSVGTIVRQDVDYAKGSAGNWCATNAVIYPGGKCENLNIIKGRYKA